MTIDNVREIVEQARDESKALSRAGCQMRMEDSRKGWEKVEQHIGKVIDEIMARLQNASTERKVMLAESQMGEGIDNTKFEKHLAEAQELYILVAGLDLPEMLTPFWMVLASKF